MKNLRNKVALITGASSGIGEAFVYELAGRGMNLIITARSETKLKILAEKIPLMYHVKVLVIPGDLSKKETAENMMSEIAAAGLSVDLLVNNAGFGKWGNFLDEEVKTYEEMIELNINSLIKLSHLALPGMLKKGSGGIINVASTGAFQPCPYIAVYCASKTFVLSFSESLYGEYEKQGISVLALCPGNTSTGFQEIAGANTAGMRADTPEIVVQQGVEALLRNESYKIVGLTNYFQSFLPRILPRKSIIWIVGNMMKQRTGH
jgi:short-subunit dehydrogenase